VRARRSRFFRRTSVLDSDLYARRGSNAESFNVERAYWDHDAIVICHDSVYRLDACGSPEWTALQPDNIDDPVSERIQAVGLPWAQLLDFDGAVCDGIHRFYRDIVEPAEILLAQGSRRLCPPGSLARLTRALPHAVKSTDSEWGWSSYHGDRSLPLAGTSGELVNIARLLRCS